MPRPDPRARGRSGSRLSKLLALDHGDARRLAEAALALLAARVALRLFRVETLVLAARRVALASSNAGAGPHESGGSETPDQDGRLAWAVAAASGVLGTTCLPRSLALCWLLARNGRVADVCLGAPRAGRPFPWHAWVEMDGRPVVGGGAAPGDADDGPFELVCRLPREPATMVGAASNRPI